MGVYICMGMHMYVEYLYMGEYGHNYRYILVFIFFRFMSLSLIVLEFCNQDWIFNLKDFFPFYINWVHLDPEIRGLDMEIA